GRGYESPWGGGPATGFSRRSCSRGALRPASTNEKPSVESIACSTSSSPSPVKPASVVVTNVDPSPLGVKVHSTVVGPPCPCHSMRMRLFGSMAFAATGIEMPYISQYHSTCLPVSSLPLLLVNQNFVVMSGLTNASNTSPTGLRMSIPVFAIGTCLSWRLSIPTPQDLTS